MKNRTVRFFVLLGLIAIVLTLAAVIPGTTARSGAVVPSLHAAESGCTLQTLHGSYIYSADGYVSSTPGQFTPISEAGIYTYDGNGNLTTTNTISFGGQIFPRTAAGTYSMNTDCTGSVSVSGGVTFNFAVTRSSSEMRFVVSAPSAVVAGSMIRQ